VKEIVGNDIFHLGNREDTECALFYKNPGFVGLFGRLQTAVQKVWNIFLKPFGSVQNRLNNEDNKYSKM